MEKKSLGQALKEARQKRGLTLDAVAATTRISPPALESIEKDEWGEPPADVYLRGFVRAYVRAVDAPETESMAAVEEILLARRQGTLGQEGVGGENGRPIMPVMPVGATGKRSLVAVGIVAALAAVGAVIYFVL